MRTGVDAIVQSALEDENWYGRPDVLLRTDAPSAFGAWAYRSPIRSSRGKRAVGPFFNWALLRDVARIQGRPPERFYVVTPDTAAPVTSIGLATTPLTFA